MTTLLALAGSIWPYILAAAGVLAAFVTRWWTKRQGAQAVARAKVDTAEQTRDMVVAESQVAATQAQADALAVRTASNTTAAATAAKGDDALNQALADKGALRD